MIIRSSIVRLIAGWEFESTNNVPEGDVPDKDYMYFGYWMKSPTERSTDMPPASTNYAFASFFGGNSPFSVGTGLLDATGNVKATYEGGAAGTYVTRELRINNADVDPISPGFHGRFTAKAELTAYFGTDPAYSFDDDMDPETDNVNYGQMIHGTLTEFMDGSKELGFNVTLDRTRNND